MSPRHGCSQLFSKRPYFSFGFPNICLSETVQPFCNIVAILLWLHLLALGRLRGGFLTTRQPRTLKRSLQRDNVLTARRQRKHLPGTRHVSILLIGALNFETCKMSVGCCCCKLHDKRNLVETTLPVKSQTLVVFVPIMTTKQSFEHRCVRSKRCWIHLTMRRGRKDPPPNFEVGPTPPPPLGLQQVTPVHHASRWYHYTAQAYSFGRA